MIIILAVLLALAIGWCWGHRTARIRHVPAGAAHAQAAAYLDARHRGIDLDEEHR
ncbi:hypothetical protein [Streptomyces sp. AD55]|uniref:hypothetical protein n=1 Tax=Streptomyces sp. AD55 TaxID=3242895 RepID=UPI0035286C2C